VKGVTAILLAEELDERLKQARLNRDYSS